MKWSPKKNRFANNIPVLTQPQKNIGANFYSIDIIMTVEIEGTMWDYTDFSYSTHLHSYNAVSHLCATVLERTSVKPKSANKVLSGIFLVGI